METVTTIRAARTMRSAQRSDGLTVALVPTMGYLHDGHLSLVRRARELADVVWASIFVNPTQFGPDEDLERYPRDLRRDSEQLSAEGAAVVFAPGVAEMYPQKPLIEVLFSGLERQLCGASRPVHFGGVGLVVSKLFNIVEPDVAVFGQKDAQQALLIKRLVTDLNFPVQIEVAPTVREPDGLAMSSRNVNLTPEERQAAPTLRRALLVGRETILNGERHRETVEAVMRAVVEQALPLRLEYAECRDQGDLSISETLTGPVLLLIAARTSATRLIDNEPVSF